jgi:hypothetical protein
MADTETPALKTLRERARWYRDGCPHLEDVEGYFTSHDIATDAAIDLEYAAETIARLARALSRARGEPR